ncbi:MAG: SH3 domain-containing protein [Pseudomonadota bacterium]
MIKLTFTLLAALYASFLIWGQPSEMAEVQAAPTDSLVMTATTQEYDHPVILDEAGRTQIAVTRSLTDVTPAAIIASAPAPANVQPRPIGEPVVVSLLTPDTTPVLEEPEVEDDRVLLTVTGTVVNMRTGPSTANPVVDSLPRGTLAEAMGEPENGWRQIRDVATGQTGWMSANFLDPA